MTVKDVFKVSRKTFFNPRGWIGYDNLKEQSKSIWGIVKPLFTSRKPVKEESFDQAMQRLRLTEQDIAVRKKNCWLLSRIFLGLGIVAFILGIYLVITAGTWHGLVLSLAVSALFMSQAFRYHFWHFQIKHRKLGCTFSEWKSGKINH